jgi:hypothetical protein
MSPKTRAPLGAGFRKLWIATAVSSLGDGVYFAELAILAVVGRWLTTRAVAAARTEAAGDQVHPDAVAT